jgi:hypothetical protein
VANSFVGSWWSTMRKIGIAIFRETHWCIYPLVNVYRAIENGWNFHF